MLCQPVGSGLEGPLASIATAFIIETGGYVGFLTGAAVSLALMAVHAWPGQGPVQKTAASLERDGGRSYLREQPASAP